MCGVRSAVIGLISLVLSLSATTWAYQQIELIREVGEPGRKASERLLQEPRAIALHGERIYIADSEASRIVVLDQEGNTLLTWGEKGDQQGRFRAPAGIAVDEAGRVYVADTGNNRIQVFDGEGKFFRAFGRKGSGPKEFDGPRGLAVAAGILYVADAVNARVQVLTADGVYLTSLTHREKKDEMREPVDVAVDSRNRVHVLDRDRNRVRIFDQAGSQVAAFGAGGKGTDGFNEPLGLAIDDRGNIFVADTGNAKIKKFDGQGKLLGAFGSEGIGPGQFRSPAGIKVNGAGRTYIVDRNKGTLQVIQVEVGEAKPPAPASPPASVVLADEQVPAEVTALAQGRRLWALAGDEVRELSAAGPARFGTRGSDPGQLRNARTIALDVTGNIWVADTGNDRIQKFGPDGALLQVIGRPGSGEGELRAPAGVAVTPKGNVVVADTGNRRVQVFSPKGVFLGAFRGKTGKDGQFREPAAVAVDSGENMYVADRGMDRISKHDSAGNQLWTAGTSGRAEGAFRGPESIIISTDGEVFVLDGGNARVQVFDNSGRFLRAFGSEGRGPGDLLEPTGMALDGSIRLLVADRGNKRIQAFTLRQTPAVPAEVAAQPRMNEVQLSWKPNRETYLETYKVYRADDPDGVFTLLAATTEPFYLDRGLPSNQAFHYRVTSQAVQGNESAPSATASAVTPRLVPSAPRSVRPDASEKQIALSWLPNKEPFVSSYRVYRTRNLGSGFEAVAETDRPVFLDAGLADETLYYYQVTAVGKEGDESPASEVAFATTPRPPLAAPPVEIVKIELREIFASAYKHYESHPLGTVAVRNNTDGPAAGMKLTFAIRDYMDFPTEVEVPEIGPRQQAEVPLKPVFNNRILEVTENTPLQSEIALLYYAGAEPRTVKRSHPVTLYERHAMTWDLLAKIGAFVTPKDPPVADFARSTVQPYVEAHPNLHPAIVHARALYAALGVYGLSYIVDPTSPFQEFSEKSTAVDYLQYPRDTLARKSGDCDDLSVLYASALENIGIGAAFVDVPGHVFVLLNTGVPESDRATLGVPDTLLAVHRGSVWLPVEMTMVGASFTRAWQKGAEQFHDWSARGKAVVLEIQKAWEEFRPVTLPHAETAAVRVKADEIEARFPDELQELGRQRLAMLSAGYIAALKRDPADRNALYRLGILYGENGMYAEALEQLQKLLALDRTNATALNNLGNIYFLQGRTDDARISYEAALASDPEDVGTRVNLARALLRLNRKTEARTAFQEAASADPRVLRSFGDLAAELGIAK